MDLIIQVDGGLEIYPRGKATIEWYIYDYNSLSKKADTVYQSKPFNFSNAVWQFQLYPNGQRANQSVTWISLYLVRVTAAENQKHTLHLDMSIKSNNGGTHANSRGSFVFDNTFKICGWSHFIQMSELQQNWFRIAYPQGCIKFSCDITGGDLTANVASQTGLMDGVNGLSEDFHQLLLSEQKSDVIIKVQNREFRVHRLFLETRSSVFNAMFQHNMKENSSGIISIEDCDPDIFKDFLNFIYTGKIEKLSGNAPQLFVLSDKYDVQGLREISLSYMKTNLSVDNACEMMAVADRFNVRELRELSKKLIMDNLRTMISTQQWITFMSEHTLIASEVIEAVLNFN